jgi:hypothetical protein
MPGLLSGSILRSGGSGQFIKLADAMPQLPASPSTSTGYTLITSDKLITSYASSLGNVQFNLGTMYANTTGTTLRLVGTGTLSVIVSGGTTATSTNTGALVVEGGLGVWGDAYVGGTLVSVIFTATTATIQNLSVQHLDVYSTGTFHADLKVNGDTSMTGELNVTGLGAVDLSPQAASVYIQPTLGGSITIQPSVPGNINNMAIGAFNPQDSHFLNSYATNFIGLATTATNIANGALGSIPYQTSSGTTAFIGIGSTNTVLVSNGTTATWINEASLSVNTATYADNVFIHTTSSGNYAVILSTGTNAYEQLTEDLNFSYNANITQLSVPSITASQSIYSREGNSNENNLLYVPISTLSVGTPPASPRLGDFWIDPSQGATFQYMLDGVNKVWIQFTGL